MGEARIELRQVAKVFGGTAAVERLDLRVEAGEFVVLLGPSGCGKTTTLRMIAGLETPTEGRVWIAGRDVTALRAGERDIAFVFQMFALYPHLTVEKNVAFPLRAAGVGAAEVARRVDRVLERLELTGLRKRRPGQLSGGDQQRVSLARAMVREPAAFLMDEPLGTLDAETRERTRTQLRAIHNELGATTVFVTHDQLEAMALADRIAVMRDGKLLQYDTPEAVYDHPADLYVANFIGSPGMNFVPCVRTTAGYAVEGSGAVVSGGGVTPLPERVMLGIRPEYVGVAGEGAVGAVVEHTVVLGAYNLVTARVGEHVVKARVAAGVRPADGEGVRLAFAAAGCRWFDLDSGRALGAGGA